MQYYQIADYPELFKKQQKRALELRSESIQIRKAKLKKLYSWIFENRQEIIEAIQKDLGKPQVEIDLTEIQPIASEIRFALNHVNRWARPTKVTPTLFMVGTRSKIQYEPKGVCLIISPWNFPFNLTLSPVISAIAAGNTVIIKPSERSVHTSALIKKMVEDICKPTDAVVVLGGVEEAEALLKLPFNHIFFTGSTKVGTIVMEAAAKNLASVTLELGGKTPAIIDETADLKDTVSKLTWGKFLNCGQTCIAPDYIMVHESKYKSFIEAMKDKTEKYFNDSQNGFDNSDEYGRIIDKRHLNQLSQTLDEAVAQGANILMGGEVDEKTKYFSPTLITDVSIHSRILNEEIFGPILPIIRYTELDKAIAYINDKPKPLSLYIFSKSRRNKNKILRETSSGGVVVNDNVIHFSHLNLPFGGVNSSGVGKSHGYFGFLVFSNVKSVLEQRVGITNTTMIYPPYNNWVKKIAQVIARII